MRKLRLWFWWRMENLSHWWLRKAHASAGKSQDRNQRIYNHITANRDPIEGFE